MLWSKGPVSDGQTFAEKSTRNAYKSGSCEKQGVVRIGYLLATEFKSFYTAGQKHVETRVSSFFLLFVFPIMTINL